MLLAVLVAAALGASAAQAAQPPGYQVVHSAAVTVSAGTQRHSVISCPMGKVVLDGGATVTATFGDVFLNGSYPEATTGWGVDVNNANLIDASFEVWAVCADQNGAGMYTVVQSPFTIAVDAGTQALATAVCPAGTRVLGGGAASTSSDTAVNLNSSYPFKRRVGASTQFSWQVEMNNASANQTGVIPVAICGRERGYRFVKGPAVSNPAGQSTSASATCPGATVPIGGGLVSKSGNVLTNLIEAAPTSTGWLSQEGNGDVTGHKIVPYAICAGS
jgi:hypothetical protein